MHNAPERIYLQIDPNGTDPTEEFLIDGATWCQDKINESDVEYVRADEIDRLRAEVAELRTILRQVRTDMDAQDQLFPWWAIIDAALAKDSSHE